MAWNQPGGNGGRDPWGDRGQQGPPDLDEVLRKLQAHLARLFGRRPGGFGGGRGLGFGGSPAGLGLVALVAFVAWLLAGVWIIKEPERGVVLRFGKYDRTIGPGFNWAPYFVDQVLTVNVDEVRGAEIGFRRQGGTSGSVPHESLMLTKDENIVDLQFGVQYQVKDPAAFLFNVNEPEVTLRAATESAVREIVGRSTMDYVITQGRGAVASEVQSLTQEILDRYGTGLRILSVNMQSAQPPAQVQDAFLDVNKAREDRERIINEARAYEADVLPKARGDASAIVQRAEGYRQRVTAEAGGETARFLSVLAAYRKAPDVTRQRLYLETMESVLSNTSKVLVDVPGGNNLLYLPLDKLIGAHAGTHGDAAAHAYDGGAASASPSSDYGSGRRSRDSSNERSR